LSRTLASRAWLGLIAALAGGCVPIALPPSKVSITGGGAAQTLEQPDPTAGSTQASSAVTFRAEVDPLQFWDPPTRPIDVGVGLVLSDFPDAERADEARLGPSVGAVAHLWAERLGDDGIARLSVGGNLDLLASLASGLDGFGVAGVFEAEIGTMPRSDFGASGDEDGVFVGGAIGSLTVALRVEAAYQYLDDGTHRFLLTAGLRFRLPAMLGVFIFTE